MRYSDVSTPLTHLRCAFEPVGTDVAFVMCHPHFAAFGHKTESNVSAAKAEAEARIVSYLPRSCLRACVRVCCISLELNTRVCLSCACQVTDADAFNHHWLRDTIVIIIHTQALAEKEKADKVKILETRNIEKNRGLELQRQKTELHNIAAEARRVAEAKLMQSQQITAALGSEANQLREKAAHDRAMSRKLIVATTSCMGDVSLLKAIRFDRLLCSISR
jgi:hypothetical protein